MGSEMCIRDSFYAIPGNPATVGFEPGILLFVIILSSLLMAWALMTDKPPMDELVPESIASIEGGEDENHTDDKDAVAG